MTPPLLSTVLLDPPTALLFGSVAALASSKLISRSPETEVWRTALIGGGWGGFYAVCVGYMYFNAPDWMLVYLKDARDVSLVPSFLGFAAVVALFGFLGALAGAELIARKRQNFAWLLVVGALGTLAACFWLQWAQYVVIGTRAEYLAGTATAFTASPFQGAMNVVGGVSTIVSVAVLGLRWQRGRRAPALARPPAGS